MYALSPTIISHGFSTSPHPLLARIVPSNLLCIAVHPVVARVKQRRGTLCRDVQSVVLHDPHWRRIVIDELMLKYPPRFEDKLTGSTRGYQQKWRLGKKEEAARAEIEMESAHLKRKRGLEDEYRER